MLDKIIKVTTGKQSLSVVGKCIVEDKKNKKHKREPYLQSGNRKTRKAEDKHFQMTRKPQVGPLSFRLGQTDSV